VRTDDLDYLLPADAIAQRPIESRDAARLLVTLAGRVEHHHVTDLATFLRPGDVVVVNDSRVLPARVPIRRVTGGAGEVLLLEEGSDGWWEALVRPARKLRTGDEVTASLADGLSFEIGEDLGEGRRSVRPIHSDSLLEALDRAGEMPLPPYIGERLVRPERYQTIYAKRPVSAAAPTAGLHLTQRVLDGIAAAGATVHRVELAVGLGTFRPIVTDRLEDHEMHAERYLVPASTMDAITTAERVVAIGTTTVRALESAALGELEGSTRIFIRPGFDWKVVDVLMTNFHLPRSSLLAMVEAFSGPGWRDLYATALREGYRFLSFGDAMLLERAAPEVVA